MEYFIAKKISKTYEEAIVLVTEKLKEIGFGVISEIDISKKLKEKIDTDFRKYTILGACQPYFAYKALTVNDKIGVLLPCNVVVQEIDSNTSEVIAMNPKDLIGAMNDDNLSELAIHIEESMKKLIENL